MILSPSLVAFVEEGVGVHIGTCNARLEPSGARALAVSVEPDGTHLVVFLAEVAAERLMSDLNETGRAAISFGRPIDDRACQVKGDVVGIRPADASERETIQKGFESFLAGLEYIGIPRANWVLWPAVAIRVKATSVFEQTPGPAAGTPMP